MEFKYLYFDFALTPGSSHSLLALTEGNKLSASTFAQSDVGKWRCRILNSASREAAS